MQMAPRWTIFSDLSNSLSEHKIKSNFLNVVKAYRLLDDNFLIVFERKMMSVDQFSLNYGCK